MECPLTQHNRGGGGCNRIVVPRMAPRGGGGGYEKGHYRTLAGIGEELVPKVAIESAGLLVREDEEFISLALDQYDGDRTWR
jgi:hypothetical protein